MTETRKKPVAGYSLSVAGNHFNHHYSSESSAKAAFDREIESAASCFGKSAYIVESLPIAGNHVESVRMRNRKANGKPGKYSATITLYRIDDRQAETYMRSPFYQCLD